ncbi:exosome complex component MTR3-like isoform X1 [Pieris brassicae]|uniref:Uncharacterized protein n=1 Tax=Pieris brassicae TaxID=7116 RepID=A0A9P0X1S6_PIEBR|nr:exosome complex component MTR3-like isoform X1 [Pieris brassicae]CAH3947173.1 unnamed protein product [Pieris brassicae]
MPFDYRRFNGPEDSVSYKRFSEDFLRTYDELYKDLLDENGKRKDGRALNEARSLCTSISRTNIVSQAKGSAYVELNKTKVICSVFDPREITGHQNEYSWFGQIYCEVKFAPFSCPRKRRQLVPDSDEKALSADLKKALETVVRRDKFPNFQMDIFVYILEHDGGCLSAAINAAGLALADAVVPMYDIVSASSVAIINDQIIIDPTEAEEHLALMYTDKEKNHGLVTMCFMHHLKQFTDFRQIGSVDAECVLKVMDILEKECDKLMLVIKKIMVSNVVRQHNEHKVLLEEAKFREEVLQSKVEEWRKLLNAG